MDDMHAQSLQKQAIVALSQLRAWIWTQHSNLLPDDVATITREHATLYSAYLEWYGTVETALQAVAAAVPSFRDSRATAQLARVLLRAQETPGSVDPPGVETPIVVDTPVVDTPAPATLRVTPAPRPTSRSGVWHRTIAISALTTDEPAARHDGSGHTLAGPGAARHAHARRLAGRRSAA